MEERLNAIIGRINKEKFERFLLIKQELKDICIPSTNPDSYNDLISTLSDIERCLSRSLLND